MDDRQQTIYDAIIKSAHLTGEVWECGVYSGDTALAMRTAIETSGHLRTLRLFDTFSGMPVMGTHDTHPIGSMRSNEAEVRQRFTGYQSHQVAFEAGVMPATFTPFTDTQISVANIDVDQYESVLACLDFIYPRTQGGGHIFLDDYNCPGCPGAKLAVNEFMVGKPEKLILSSHRDNPQAWVIKQ